MDRALPPYGDVKESSHSLVFELASRGFTITGNSLAYVLSNRGSIVSILDLAGARMTVQLLAVPTEDENLNKEVKAIVRSIELKQLKLRMTEGREFSIVDAPFLHKISDKDGHPVFLYDFPKG